jgi:hypothetical protein
MSDQNRETDYETNYNDYNENEGYNENTGYNQTSNYNVAPSNEMRDLIETNRQLILQFGNIIDLNREMFQSYTRLTEQYISNQQRNYNTSRSNIPARNYTTPYYYYTFPLSLRNNILDASANTASNFFDPITIYPTATQIENAVRRVEYGNITSPMNLSCPITLERFNDTNIVSVIRYCGHIFNSVALNTWFRTNCRCPVCRYDIRTPVSNVTNNLTREEVPEPEPEEEESEEEEPQPSNSFTNIVTNLLNETISIDEGFSEIISQLNTMDSSSNLSIPITMFSLMYERYRTV